MKNLEKVYALFDSGHSVRAEIDGESYIYSGMSPKDNLFLGYNENTGELAVHELSKVEESVITAVPFRPEPYEVLQIVEINELAPAKYQKYRGMQLKVIAYSMNNDIYDLVNPETNSQVCYNVPHYALTPVL